MSADKNPQAMLLKACLLTAAKRGSLVVVKALLSHPLCELLARDEEGNTALHLAASGGYHEVVLELASKYDMPSGGRNDVAQTPLHMAASKGRVECVRVLATLFPDDLKVKDKYDNLPLHTAALFGHTDTVDCLCQEFNGDIESLGNFNTTCLHLSCCGGHIKLTQKLLLKYNSRRDALDEAGGLASSCAASYGHTHLLEMLIDEFNFSPTAKRLSDGMNLLHLACVKRHIKTIYILIKKYCLDPNALGHRVLHCVCLSGGDTLENVANFHFPDDIELTALVDMLVGLKCDPMDKDKDGATALHYAAYSGETKMVSQLVTKYKCVVEDTDTDGDTPLHYAAMGGKAGVVFILLSELDANIQARNQQNHTALHIAALNGHTEVVTLLVEQFGCSPNTKGFKSRTPLHYACDGGHLELAKRLIDDYHCDPMARDDDGATPLHISTLAGKEIITSKLILKYKCSQDISDNDGETPLHYAASRGNAGIVHILLTELGANIQARDKHNKTALHIAALNGRTEVVTLLVEQFGCSPNTKGFKNRTPLHYACDGGHLELAEKLIDDYHCDPMARDDDGATPLHISALTGKEIIMSKLILKYKCSQDISDNDGETPLHYATSRGNAGIVHILLSELGANMQARNKHNKTALHIAALNGRTEVVTLLVEQFGCSPNTKGFKNRTPLHNTCEGGHLELAEKLIDDYHCDPMARDDDGATPLHISTGAGKEIMMSKLILKYKCSQYFSDDDGDTLLHYLILTKSSAIKCLEFLVGIIGTFPSIKNNKGKLPIDREPSQLFHNPNMRTCVAYLSKHAVGEYRHAPPKLLVFDKKIVSALNDYSIYSLLSPTFAQSCGLCYMDSLVNDLWVCQFGAEAQPTSLLQSLLSGPILIVIITINVNLTTNEAMTEALAQLSLAKQLAYRDGSTKVPLRIMLAGNSSLDKEDVFNEICKKIVDKQPINFAQHFLSCANDKFSENIFPIISDFINTSVSTVPNPDVREITHGSIQLLKFLYQNNFGRFYVKFSELAKQLHKWRIMSEDHPEEILACLRQLDTQGYLVATGTSDLPKYIILNPLHMLQVMKQFSQNTSDTFARLGLYSQRLLGSIFPDAEISLIEYFLLKLRLFLTVPDPLVNLVMKQDLYKHLAEKHFFIPQLATSCRQLTCWTCQPESVFSCGLRVITPGNLDSFPPQLTTNILIQAMQFIITNFLNEPYSLVDCTLWKGGILWMFDNVEILVEVVQEESSVVLMGRSDVCNQLKCMDMFVKIVDMVLEVKSVCCGGIVHKVDALDPNALESKTIPCGDEMLWCDASSAVRALTRSRKNIQSKCKTKQFSIEKLEWLFRFSLRGKESPIDS